MEVNKIICGDCKEVMADWPDNCVDLVLTDPPYGIECVTNSNRMKELGYEQFQGDNFLWDINPVIAKGQHNIVFGGNYFKLPISRSWLVWDKQAGKQVDWGDCELIWTDFNKPIRKYTHIWDGFRRDSEWGEKRHHPCQKPVILMLTLLSEYSQANSLILDPFCGSGTTCVAAKMLGRRYIGIDISEKYCEIARQRLEAVDTGVPVKEQKIGQLPMFPIKDEKTP